MSALENCRSTNPRKALPGVVSSRSRRNDEVLSFLFLVLRQFAGLILALVVLGCSDGGGVQPPSGQSEVPLPAATDVGEAPSDPTPREESPVASEPASEVPPPAATDVEEAPSDPTPREESVVASEPARGVLPDADALKREAVLVAQQVVKQFPDDASSQILLAAVHYNQGNSAEAVNHLEACLELDPHRADALAMLAAIARQRGEAERCVEYCRKALAIDSKPREVHQRLGEALLELGRTQELIEAMRQAVQLAPDSSQIHYLLGQGYLQSRDYAEAKKSFLATVALRPDHTQAYFGLYTACARLRQRDEANRYRAEFTRLEAADRAALRDSERNPISGLDLVRQTTARTLFGAGQVCAVHRQLAQAESLWRRASILDPENMPARSGLIALYGSQRRMGKAVEFFQHLTKVQPDNTLNYYVLGRAFVKMKGYSSAENAYRTMTQVRPDQPQGYVALADHLLQTGRKPDEAKRLAEKAVQLEPIAANYVLLAQACQRNGERSRALDAIQRAQELDPKNPQYQQIRQRIEEGG